MLILLFAVLIGIVLTFFSLENTVPVTFTVLGYQFTSIPLFIVSIIFLVLGLVVGLVVNAFTTASSFFQLRSRDSALREKDAVITRLKDQVQNLQSDYDEMKNRHTDKLAAEKDRREQAEEDAREYRPSLFSTFFSRFKEGFH